MSHSMHVHSYSHSNRPERWSNQDASSVSNGDQRLEMRRTRDRDQKVDDSELRHKDGGERAARPNPLVNAMMLALQGLTAGGSSQAASSTPAVESTDPVVEPTTTAQTEAGAEVAKTSSGDLKEAAAAFAHELIGALRGEDGDQQVKRGHGHHHHFGHHHGHTHGWGGRGGAERAEGAYSNLAQRLETLAAKLSPQQPATPATSDPATGQAAPTVPGAEVADAPASSEVATPVAEPVEPDAVPSEATVAAAAGPTININVNINIQVNFSGLPATGADSPAAPASPLLAAFEKLLEKLQGPATETDGQASASSSSDKLREFLLGIAGNLKVGLAGGEQTDLVPSTGSLINIAA